MNTIRALFLTAGILEAILGFPVLGGSLIILLFWIPLIFAFALHLVNLVIAIKSNEKLLGSIVGIVASAVGWIPIVGMILHILASIFNFYQSFRK